MSHVELDTQKGSSDFRSDALQINDQRSEKAYFTISSFHRVRNAWALDYSGMKEVIDELSIGGSRASPSHWSIKNSWKRGS